MNSVKNVDYRYAFRNIVKNEAFNGMESCHSKMDSKLSEEYVIIFGTQKMRYFLISVIPYALYFIFKFNAIELRRK